MNTCKWRENPFLKKEALAKMLVEEFLTYEEIAARAGCSRCTVITAIRQQHLNTGPVKLKRRLKFSRRR